MTTIFWTTSVDDSWPRSGLSPASSEVNPMACPKCQGEMRIIAFLTDYAVVDRIINHLKLTFVADRPPPPHIAYQEVLMATEPSAEYIS